MASGQTPEAPRPGTDQLRVATSPSSDRRPGSDVKVILPPIPTGRKTPASPRPIPTPAVKEGEMQTGKDSF